MTTLSQRWGPRFTVLAILAIFVPMLSGSVLAAPDSASGGSAVIANAEGDKVRLRVAPASDAEISALLSEDTAVSITGQPEVDADGTQWMPVTTESGPGYVAAQYLAAVDIQPTELSGTATTSDTVNLRATPGTAGEVLAILAVGVPVEITGGTMDGWVPVTVSGHQGYVYADFLSEGIPEISAKAASGTRYVLESLRLRTGPGTGYGSMAVLPVGTRLELTGRVEGGFAKVSSYLGTGWVSAQYIGPTSPGGGGSSSSGERAYTNDAVSLRSGPGTGYSRLAVLTLGTRLSLTGSSSGGFSKVTASAGTGWVSDAYISSVAPQYTGGTRYTIDSVNLRTAPRTSSGVIRVVSSSTEIRFTGTVVNNFGKVSTSFGDGWISIDYFRKTRPGSSSSGGPSRVVWPVKGSSWYVSQGYNGSSHQNETKYWQYYYSFDIKRSSGSTAWQPVYAPVDGRVRWIDESTGGLSIYMGDGLAFAMFHMYLDGSIKEGQTIRQGQYLGVIAPSGKVNNGGSPHLHITGWTTSDEGNWSRHAQPFVGRFTIEGASFPATGKHNDYLGYTFWP